MITPVHLVFDIGLYLLTDKLNIVDVNNIDLIILVSAELIDLDHLLSKPIYHPRRNPFAIHLLHKKWPAILLTALLFLLYRPVLFLGIGLLSHLLLDYLYVKIYRLDTTIQK